ncbi:MAG: hypothetical protein HY821_15535 [Acidobacteria bacterium]|nr:hypothetical protein [Acidobacteriota bacterium]
MNTMNMMLRIGALAMMVVLAMPGMGLTTVAMRATVPFSFEAGAHIYPAGQYEVEYGRTGSALVLTTAEGKRQAIMTFPAGDSNQPKSPRLVFEKTGNGYRLTEAWVSGSGFGVGGKRHKSPTLIGKEVKAERVEIAMSLR